jgi:hypothetical protein
MPRKSHVKLRKSQSKKRKSHVKPRKSEKRNTKKSQNKTRKSNVKPRKSQNKTRKSHVKTRKSEKSNTKKSQSKTRKLGKLIYKMNGKNEESDEKIPVFHEIFEKCTQSEVDLYEKQQFYEEYMDASSCILKYILFRSFPECKRDRERGRERERERESDLEKEKVILLIRIIESIGEILKINYSNNLLLFSKNKGKYKGKIPISIDKDQDDIEMLNENRIYQFFNLRTSSMASAMSLSGYPKLREIFDSYFRKNNLEVEEYEDDLYHLGTMLKLVSQYDPFIRMKVGRFQILSIGSYGGSSLSIYHPDELKTYFNNQNNIASIKNTALYELSLKWCDILNKYNDYKYGVLDDLDNIKKLCFEIYYLFINIVPYVRGSATAAKVLLNACLSAFGFDYVKETPEYHKQADWIAFVSEDFDDFYSKVDKMFMVKEE